MLNYTSIIASINYSTFHLKSWPKATKIHIGGGGRGQISAEPTCPTMLYGFCVEICPHYTLYVHMDHQILHFRVHDLDRFSNRITKACTIGIEISVRLFSWRLQKAVFSYLNSLRVVYINLITLFCVYKQLLWKMERKYAYIWLWVFNNSLRTVWEVTLFLKLVIG